LVEDPGEHAYRSSGCLSGRSHVFSLLDLPLKKNPACAAQAERHVHCLLVMRDTPLSRVGAWQSDFAPSSRQECAEPAVHPTHLEPLT